MKKIGFILLVFFIFWKAPVQRISDGKFLLDFLLNKKHTRA